MKGNTACRQCIVALLLALSVIGLLAGEPQAVYANPTAVTFYVAPSGQDSLECGSQTNPCKTIQYAVNLAATGDEVLVAEGVYTFSAETDVCTGRIGGSTAVVCFFDKELTILGGYNPNDWYDRDPVVHPTIIDGQHSLRGVRLQKSYSSAPTASLSMAGFTVRNGLALGKSSGSSDVTFAFGGGLLSEHASVTLEDMVFVGNEARGGTTSTSGGAGAGGGVAANTTWGGVSVQLVRVIFENNHATGGDGGDRGGPAIGGGIFTYGVSVQGDGLEFSENGATAGRTATGAGVESGERADAQGAAIALHGGTSAVLAHVTATDNVAQGGDAPQGEAGGAFGGAIFVENSSATFYDSVIRANRALGGNGRNSTNLAAQAWGGGIACMNSSLTISRVQVIANLAEGGDGAAYGGAVSGGGVAVTSVTSAYRSAEIINSIIADNVARVGSGQLIGGGGGGLWLLGVDAKVEHSTIAHNQIGQNLLGQGVILVKGALPTRADIDYSIISDHTGLVNTAALHAQSGTTVDLNKTMYANNTIDDNHDRNFAGAPGTFIGLSSVIHNAGSVGYISPGAPYYNYHLQRASSARDQVSPPVLSVDIDDQARSGAADLGADEYVLPIDLTVRAVDSTTLKATWYVDLQYLASTVIRYQLHLTCEPGAASPPQMQCNSSIYIEPSQTSLSLTNLTEYAHYEVSLAVVDGNGNAIETSDSVTAFPTALFVFAPLTIK